MLKQWLVLGILNMQNFVLHILKFMIYARNSRAFSPKHICVYRIGNIGDLLCTIPALWQIRNKYPEAKITLLSSPGKIGAISAKAVLPGFSCVDDILLYYQEDINSWCKIKKFQQWVRGLDVDYFIQIPAVGTHFCQQIKLLLFFRFAGMKCADGFYLSTSNLFPRVQMQYFHPPTEVLRCIRHLPFRAEEKVVFNFLPTSEDAAYVQKFIRETVGANVKPVLAVSFFGKKAVQRWPLHNFAVVARRWVEEKDGIVVLIGGKTEKDMAEQIRMDVPEALGERVLNVCGRFTIPQSIYFLQQCQLLLSIDTGTAHMAAIANVPCVGIYSAYNLPYQWYAYGRRVKILRKDLPCSPCMKSDCRYGEFARCMMVIKPDDVWQQILDI